MTDECPHSPLSYCPEFSTAGAFVRCQRENCADWGPVLPFRNPQYPDTEVRPDASGWTKLERTKSPLYVLGCRRINGEVR